MGLHRDYDITTGNLEWGTPILTRRLSQNETVLDTGNA